MYISLSMREIIMQDENYCSIYNLISDLSSSKNINDGLINDNPFTFQHINHNEKCKKQYHLFKQELEV